MLGGESQTWRVLIADEAAEARSQLGGLIKGWECETIEVADGHAALNALRQGAVDGAFVHADLPGISGWEVVRGSRECPRRVPVILFTRTGTSGAEEEMMSSLATEELVAPPVDRDVLIQAIQRALEGARPRPEAEAYREQQARVHQSYRLESIGRLATGVAHDFNNLLTIIMGYSEILLATLGENDPLRPNLEQIQKAGDRAAALARQLLAFGRRQPLAPVLLNVSAVVNDLDKMLQRLIGEDIEIVTSLEPCCGPVKADQSQIEQVIVNVVLNARDAMPLGGRLTIETVSVVLDEAASRRLGTLHAGPHVVLSVSDNGCGMDAETQVRVFEPFFTTKEPGKGTGLGLSIVLDIVKQCHGSIRICSELNRGTNFTIYLPVATEDEQAVPAPASESTSLAYGQETVLVAEDEEGVRGLVRDILERHGYTVLEAREGEHAIRVCEQYPGPIHLLVADVVMRQVNGKELVERVTPIRPGMRVLYMSGHTAGTVAEHGVLNSDVTFLEKPFSPEAFIIRVRKVLEVAAPND